uniref:Uncharacterized protein n=1 Tax=Anguilla anguilla TaxID=7936 RepID=A0A0E9S494_ANGAN
MKLPGQLAVRTVHRYPQYLE